MTFEFYMNREDTDYQCCNPDFANSGVLEVREQLCRKFEHRQIEVGYFGQFYGEPKNEERELERSLKDQYIRGYR